MRPGEYGTRFVTSMRARAASCDATRSSSQRASICEEDAYTTAVRLNSGACEASRDLVGALIRERQVGGAMG